MKYEWNLTDCKLSFVPHVFCSLTSIFYAIFIIMLTLGDMLLPRSMECIKEILSLPLKYFTELSWHDRPVHALALMPPCFTVKGSLHLNQRYGEWSHVRTEESTPFLFTVQKRVKPSAWYRPSISCIAIIDRVSPQNMSFTLHISCHLLLVWG